MEDSRVNTLVSCIDKLREFPVKQDNLKDMKSALDAFFAADGKCANFILTNNLDKLPFGCIVFPVVDYNMMNNFMIVGESTVLHDYEVELDSKMFDYGLTNEEVASVILFNIYHLIKDTKPCNNVREAIDDFFTDECKNLVIRNNVQYQAILTLGCVDALHQVSSCFNLPDDVLTDAFLESVGLMNLKSALDKIYKQFPGCNNETLRQPNLSLLKWCLRLYDNVDKERIPALHMLNKAKSITNSMLYINRFNSVINALNRIDDDLVVNEAVQQVFTEAKRRGGLLASLKYNGLRDIESDLYEFQIRAKNAETEQDVMYALKQINARLAILDDYIRQNQDDPDIDRWVNVKIQYMDIRDVLAKKRLHKRSYGIFVDYDALDALDDDNNSDNL